jgi:hypothetical protein
MQPQIIGNNETDEQEEEYQSLRKKVERIVDQASKECELERKKNSRSKSELSAIFKSVTREKRDRSNRDITESPACIRYTPNYDCVNKRVPSLAVMKTRSISPRDRSVYLPY